jgi:hypothetical protein
MPLTRQQTVTAALSLSAIWLLTHRYHGIHHDALFYAVQALAHAAPARFEHDLFFAFGSQDDYTLFTPAYAWLGRQAGLGNAAFVLLVAAQCLWAFAAIRIARQWLQGLFLVAGLALLFALPGQYGHDPVFRYAESFLTARVWAECLVLNGLAATLAGRSGLAAAAVLGASLLHPIMALPGLLFLAFYHGYRNTGNGLLLLLPVLALGGRLRAMPRHGYAPWIELVRRRAPFVLHRPMALAGMARAIHLDRRPAGCGARCRPGAERIRSRLHSQAPPGWDLRPSPASPKPPCLFRRNPGVASGC